MTIYIVDLEAVETRYTGQWKTHVPYLFSAAGIPVTVIDGPTDIPPATSPGAFLNFGGTNIYKAVQVEKIARLFCDNVIQPGDQFLFTDAWHPGIINLKYMSELLNIPVKIHALWHAGSYDPADFLGRLIGAAKWVRHSEKAFFNAIDFNYFATDFHIDLFAERLLEARPGIDKWAFEKMIRTGWPMDYMPATLAPYANLEKRDLILFPHRIAPEKQVEIFRDLAKRMPQYEFVVCQDQQLTKHEYHTLLGQAKIVFSASLQETLGIGCYEGVLTGAIPIVPDRLSYQEMYASCFKYPSNWTESWEKYKLYAPDLVWKIIHFMDLGDVPIYKDTLSRQASSLTKNFFTASKLMDNIKSLDLSA